MIQSSAMVEKIRKSVEGLEAPACPTCGKPMSWFSAQLIEYSPVTIEHTFYCAPCGTQKRKSVRSDESVDPRSKLSLPNNDRAA
jgi:C4-type Zn-finger protein